ncbi:hypothetical protein ACLRGI_15110 [Paenarthrobacter nitroguajacolicus]|uniref:hypothetical protein n=1 Tax=Paenarthrobacter nitroguajacolicus TaxID=211146 RepID=UPI003AE474FD
MRAPAGAQQDGRVSGHHPKVRSNAYFAVPALAAAAAAHVAAMAAGVSTQRSLDVGQLAASA